MCICWYPKAGVPTSAASRQTHVATSSHVMTGGLPRLGVWARSMGLLAPEPVSARAPSVELLGDYSLGPNPSGTVLDPRVCHSNLQPTEVRC
jgi:hypothetical protein